MLFIAAVYITVVLNLFQGKAGAQQLVSSKTTTVNNT